MILIILIEVGLYVVYVDFKLKMILSFGFFWFYFSIDEIVRLDRCSWFYKMLGIEFSCYACWGGKYFCYLSYSFGYGVIFII